MEPSRKKKQDRSKATCKRTGEKDIKAMGLKWAEAEMAALNKIGWRKRVEASCSVWSQEQEEEEEEDGDKMAIPSRK